MKPSRTYLFALSLVGLALALPCRSAAASGQSLHLTFMGLTANASFDTLDSTGCIDTSAFVSATNGTTKMNNVPGSPEASSTASVGISQFNFCTGDDLFEAFASPILAPGAFQINKTLTSATLNTSTDMTDSISGNTFTVQISISWAAIPGATPTAFRFTFLQRPGGSSCPGQTEQVRVTLISTKE